MDEVCVYTMLDSPLAAALTHAATITGAALNADVAAVRVVNMPGDGIQSYVDARRLALGPAKEQAVQAWPMAKSSIFGYAVEHELIDVACRPRERMDEVEYQQQNFFGDMQKQTAVVDAVLLSFVLIDRVWAIIVLLRCNQSKAFDDRQIDALERFKPAISRMMRDHYLRQVGLPTAGNQPAPTKNNVAELLAKLSPTERQVLNYLRSDMTERQIAQAVHRSPHTVHVHVKNIYRKLNISSRKALLDLL